MQMFKTYIFIGNNSLPVVDAAAAVVVAVDVVLASVAVPFVVYKSKFIASLFVR